MNPARWKELEEFTGKYPYDSLGMDCYPGEIRVEVNPLIPLEVNDLSDPENPKKMPIVGFFYDHKEAFRPIACPNNWKEKA